MLGRLTLALAMIAASNAARADTTAVYKAKSLPMSMSIEIADEGAVRYQMSQGRTYGLVLKDVDYFVEMGARGPVVDRANDLITAQREAMAAMLPDFAKHFQEHGGAQGPPLVAGGKITINGRVGRAYSYPSANKEPKTEPVVVISDDPDLAPIGKVMANQFGKSMTMVSSMMGGNTPGLFKEMVRVLQTGAPLRFAGMELISVNHAAIDPKRFDLPGEPETLDQIRDRLKPLPPPPTATLDKP
jgi:hypothetical protein